MRRILTEKDVESAIAGGAIFACGGGGFADHGRTLGLAAVNAGTPELVSVDELDDDAWVATAAAIGAPAGTTAWQMLGVDYIRAVELVQRELGARIAGLVIGQNGKSSTLNGWLPSAILGCKVVDAVGDIRAHPTGDMGAMGLAGATTPVIQSAVGGNRGADAYIELVTRGATARVSPILRTASDQSGGFIASCRNPVPATFIREHAALGGITMALDLGEAILASRKAGGSAVIEAICKTTRGVIVASGKVAKITVRYTSDAFDIGTITIDDGGKIRTLHLMNEYMALDDDSGERIATYPDVLTTLGRDGEALSAGELREGMEVNVLHIPKRHLPLSSSATDSSVYPPVEKALGISIAEHAIDRAGTRKTVP